MKCNIDAIGQHIYVGINGDVNADIASAMKQITAVYTAFGKPIVVSELCLFAAGGGICSDLAFAQRIVSWLDSIDHVLARAPSAVFQKAMGTLNSVFFSSKPTSH